MTETKSIISLVFALVVLNLLPGVSKASDPQETVGRVQLGVGAGGAINVYGIGEGISPSAQIALGYRLSWFAVGLDFLWNSLEYNVADDMLIPTNAMGDAHHLDGHHIGGVVHFRSYAFENDSRMNLYATIGCGSRVLIYQTLERAGFPIYAPDIERSGTIWGVVLRAGVGSEFEVSSNVFIDLSGTYDLTVYEEMVDSEYGTTQSISIAAMVKFSF
jgi:opacity protein-like surface antigen